MPRIDRRNGFSLMEVILSIAVLFASTIALAQLASLGRRHANRAEELTTAQVLCQNTMNEVVTGMTPLINATDLPIYESPGWAYSVEVQPSNWNGLVAVKVSVAEVPLETDSLSNSPSSELATDNSVETRPSYSLVRWLRAKNSLDDPNSGPSPGLLDADRTLGALP